MRKPFEKTGNPDSEDLMLQRGRERECCRRCVNEVTCVPIPIVQTNSSSFGIFSPLIYLKWVLQRENGHDPAGRRVNFKRVHAKHEKKKEKKLSRNPAHLGPEEDGPSWYDFETPTIAARKPRDGNVHLAVRLFAFSPFALHTD